MAKAKTSKQWSKLPLPEDEECTRVEVFPCTIDPTYAWEKLCVKQQVKIIKPISSESPIQDNVVRFVCVSDTHNRTRKLKIPDGDVLLHTGDFSMTGQMPEVEEFNTWLGSLPHKNKIVIAGNHDISFDDQMLQDSLTKSRFLIDAEEVYAYLKSKNVEKAKDLLTHCTYLEDSGVQLYGINIWGSPWQPEFCGWAFNLDRGQPCLDKWDLIPSKTDILLTHGPPIGHGDLCSSDHRAGCVELLHTIQKRVKPQYHVFGHIHEGYGMTTDGITKFINASTCNLKYHPVQRPIVFDIKLPEGTSKSNFSTDVMKPFGYCDNKGDEDVEEDEVSELVSRVENITAITCNENVPAGTK